MNIKPFSFILLLFLYFIISCKSSPKSYQPEGLHKMSKEEMLEMFSADEPPVDFNTIARKDSNGRDLTIEELKNFPKDSVFADYFADGQGVPKELVFRKKTPADATFEKEIIAIFEAKRAGPDIELIDVDCAEAKTLLEVAFDSDQANRGDGVDISQSIDRQNQQIVFSVIEKCGFPDRNVLSQKAVDGAFFVLQHAGHKHRVKYFSMVKKSSEKGHLKKSTVALMEDRILMGEGKRQIYGTQVSSSGDGPLELYPVEDVANVNQRRAAIGLGPLEEYLKHWEIEFDPVALEKKWQENGQ